MGMERLLSLMLQPESKNLQVFIVSNNTAEALKLVFELREKAISADFDLSNRKFNKQIEKASKIGAKFAVILGENEIKTGTLTVKNLQTGEQKSVNSSDEFFEKYD